MVKLFLSQIFLHQLLVEKEITELLEMASIFGMSTSFVKIVLNTKQRKHAKNISIKFINRTEHQFLNFKAIAQCFAQKSMKDDIFDMDTAAKLKNTSLFSVKEVRSLIMGRCYTIAFLNKVPVFYMDLYYGFRLKSIFKKVSL